MTLIHALKRANKSKGIASLCIGGGEATAIAVNWFSAGWVRKDLTPALAFIDFYRLQLSYSLQGFGT